VIGRVCWLVVSWLVRSFVTTLTSRSRRRHQHRSSVARTRERCSGKIYGGASYSVGPLQRVHGGSVIVRPAITGRLAEVVLSKHFLVIIIIIIITVAVTTAATVDDDDDDGRIYFNVA